MKDAAGMQDANSLVAGWGWMVKDCSSPLFWLFASDMIGFGGGCVSVTKEGYEDDGREKGNEAVYWRR